MKNLLIFFSFTLCFNLHSQISTTSVAKEEKIKSLKYDSLQNFLGEKYSAYIGQDLFLHPKSESLRKYGYDEFKIDPKGSSYSSSNIYKKNKRADSNYEELQNKVFTVLDVQKDDSSIFSDYAYLKLKFKDSEEIVFYRYSLEYSHNFPFTVMGYFEKTKELFVNKQASIIVIFGFSFITQSSMKSIINNTVSGDM